MATQDNNEKQSKPIPPSQRIKNIISGYIRRYIENKYNIQTPNAILILICRFYQIFEAVRFNLFNKRNCVATNDMKLYKTSLTPVMKDCHRLFLSEHGYDSGVIRYKLKFSTTSSDGDDGGIGICAAFNKTKVCAQRPWITDDSFKQCVFWNRYGLEIEINDAGMREANKLGKTKHKSAKVQKSWQDGDEIMILLDCEKWHVQFFLNDQVLEYKNVDGDMNDRFILPKNQKYHPLFCFYKKGDQYEVQV